MGLGAVTIDSSYRDLIDGLGEMALKYGFGHVAVVDHESRVLGVVTDGNLRRAGLAFHPQIIEDVFDKVASTNFLFVTENSSNFEILEKFAGNERFLVMVDGEGRFLRFVYKDSIFQNMVTTKCSSSYAFVPLRVSFFGGGTDSWEEQGEVISSTISLGVRATVSCLEGGSEHKILCDDTPGWISYDGCSSINSEPGRLIKAVLKVFVPKGQFFSVVVSSDVAVGSGLGASSAIVAAVLVALYSVTGAGNPSPHVIVYQSFYIERVILGLGGGWQDYCPGLFGGFNHIKFRSTGIEVSKLYPPETFSLGLSSAFVLLRLPKSVERNNCSTVGFKKNRPGVTSLKKMHVNLTKKMVDFVQAGNWRGFCLGLREGWELKTKIDPSSASDFVTKVLTLVHEHEGYGGKPLGASGGRYFACFIPLENRKKFVAEAEAIGCYYEAARMTSVGYRVGEL